MQESPSRPLWMVLDVPENVVVLVLDCQAYSADMEVHISGTFISHSRLAHPIFFSQITFEL